MSGFTDIPVKKGTVKYIIPTVTEKLPVLLKKGEEKYITQNFTLETELTAPVKKRDTVGYVHVFLKDEEIGAIPIVASNSSDRLTYFVCLLRVLKNLFAL
jgi:D-alanyl-D-alanine carboxypeptidase